MDTTPLGPLPASFWEHEPEYISDAIAHEVAPVMLSMIVGAITGVVLSLIATQVLMHTNSFDDFWAVMLASVGAYLVRDVLPLRSK